MASPAAPGAQSNTISLTIVQGESANPTATFTQAMAARMVSVGSGPNAHWKIRGQGVEALHAELYWDGNVLWVRNGGSLGGTYVSSTRADDWTQVFDGTEIQVGAVRIASKVVGPDARNPAGAAPGASSRSAGYIDEEESTMVFSAQMVLEGPAAPMSKPSSMAPTPQPAQPAPARGRAGTMPPPAAMHAPNKVGPQGPVAPAPAMAAPPRPAPDHDDDEPQKPPSSEATVIRASPYAALEAAGMLGPLPAAGNRNPMPLDQRTIAPGSINAPSSVVVSQSAVGLPAMTPQGMRPGTMPPQVSASLQPVQAMSPMNMQPSQGMSQPGVSQPGAYDDPFGPMDIPPPNTAQGSEKTVAGTSPRTLILAGITLVIGLIAAIMPPPNQQARNAPARPQPQVLTVGAAPPTTNNILQLPISEPGLVGVIVPAPIPMADAQGRPRAVPPPNPQDPMKLAAEAVAANRYADAMVRYERLAAEHPEAPLFRQFAAVLRARVNSMNCQPGAPGCIPTNATVPPSVQPPGARPSP